MASEALRSSPSLEDDWGCELWTDDHLCGDAAPRAQEEDTRSLFSEPEDEEGLDFTLSSNKSIPEEEALGSVSEIRNEAGLCERTEILGLEFGDETERKRGNKPVRESKPACDLINKPTGSPSEEERSADLNVSHQIKRSEESFLLKTRRGRGYTDHTDQSQPEAKSLNDSTKYKQDFRTDLAPSYQRKEGLLSCSGVQTGNGRGYVDQSGQSHQVVNSLLFTNYIFHEYMDIRTDFAVSVQRKQSTDKLLYSLGLQTESGRGYTALTNQTELKSDLNEPKVKRPDGAYAISNPIQQEAPNLQSPSQNQEALQVCKCTPPLETVANERANSKAGNLTWSSFMVSEALLIQAAGWRKAASDEETLEQSSDKVEVRRYRSKQVRKIWRSKMDEDHFNDNQSDSGVSGDLSPNNTDNETPIEKEIRLATVREESLRRSRGLDETKEFVEIPLMKSILTRDFPEKVSKDHGKERQFAGKKMEREISVEVEREKALVQLGRMPGFYDKGSGKQIREKKLLFEPFQKEKDVQKPSAGRQEKQKELEMIILNSNSVPSIKSPPNVQSNGNQEPKTKNHEIVNGNHFKETHGTNQNFDPQVFSSLKEKKLLFESMNVHKDLQNVSTGPQDNHSKPENLDQNSNSTQAITVSPNVQVSSNQEPNTKESSSESINGNHVKDNTNLSTEPKQDQDPQVLSLKEKKLLFESKKDLQISTNHNQEPPRSSRERRKSMDTFIQTLESTFRSMQEVRGIQTPRKQDAKEPPRNQAPQGQTPKPCGPGLTEAKCQVVILENTPVEQTPEPAACKPETTPDSGTLRAPQPPHDVEAQKGHDEESDGVMQNPFFKLRSSLSNLPDVQKDIEEAKQREEELRKQRTGLYPEEAKISASPSRTESSHADADSQKPKTTSVCQSLGKLDLTWPPSTSQDEPKKHPEVKDQRQKMLLVQRWESGQINS